MHTYYFLENGEVAFIELFHSAEDAKEYQRVHFPKSTLTVGVKE
jgi:hypothetical protein